MGWTDGLVLSQRPFRCPESSQDRTEEQVLSFPYGYQDEGDGQGHSSEIAHCSSPLPSANEAEKSPYMILGLSSYPCSQQLVTPISSQFCFPGSQSRGWEFPSEGPSTGWAGAEQMRSVPWG